MSDSPALNRTELNLRSALDEAISYATPKIKALDYSGLKAGVWGKESCDLWIAGLHRGFAASYPECSIYSKAELSKLPLGGIKRREFLYDILVAEVATIKSAKKRHELHVIRRPVWAIESEVATNSRAVVEDLSKLALSSAPHNLLVVSQNVSPVRYPDLFRDASQGFTQELFVAVIPSYSRLIASHQNWHRGTAAYDLFRRKADGTFSPVLGEY